MNIKLSPVSKIAAAFFLAALALPAASMNDEQNKNQIDQTKAAIMHTTLAYLKTGNVAIDQTSRNGLFGLTQQLYKRTGVQNIYVSGTDQGNPTVSSGALHATGIDPAQDNLSLYPFIYWPIDPHQQKMSSKAIQNLNHYIKSGGLLLIDTRDQETRGAGQKWLQQAIQNGLDIPALKKVKGCVKESDAPQQKDKEPCHTLGKSFFLLDHFPGRYTGSPLWAERTESYRKDGVAGVMIGGNDWASAWATDENGIPTIAVTGSDPQQREYAIRTGINIVIYALTGNYKDDIIHKQPLDKRLNPGR